ncbi:MAG: hypothetical protein LBN27_11100 [Prevotellaceae bacterium]|jgi:hypothetical protein|nr:hypothetical protein [Prevotellaceae bacterium]
MRGRRTTEWHIYSLESLQRFLKYAEAPKFNFKGCTVYLDADIVLPKSGLFFTTIKRAALFRGTFEGNGHKIYNVTDQFFGNPYGEIRNVQFVDIDITPTSTPCGCIVYSESNIHNCYFQGKIRANSGYYRKGAVTGTRTNITDCLFDMEILADNSQCAIIDGFQTMTTASINRCIAKGSILSTASDVGGICGYCSGSVRNCVSLCTSLSGNTPVGRITASYSGTLSNNFAIDTMLINGQTVHSNDVTSSNGADLSAAQSKTQSFYEDLGYDFVNVWKMSNSAGKHGGTPILQFMDDEL